MTTTEPAAQPPLPDPDELTAFYWDAARRHELWLQRCNDCGRLQHPPRPICKQCNSFDLGHAPVSGHGAVYTYSIGVQAFHPWFTDHLPYVLAVVELDDQPNLKLVTNIVDCEPDDVHVDMAVEVTFVDRGDVTLPMFRPTNTTRGA